MGILRTDQFINEAIAGRKVDLPEVKPQRGSLKRVRFFGDEQLASKMAMDAELQRLISGWHFTDVRIGGQKLQFTLDDNMVNPTFGAKRISSPGYIIQGLDIAARAAKIASS